MLQFIENIGDYFSQTYFDEGFPKKVFEKVGYSMQKKKSEDLSDEEKEALEDNHVDVFNKRVRALSEKYFQFKGRYLELHREKDRVSEVHKWHTTLLKALGYEDDQKPYEYPLHLDNDEIIPVRLQYKVANKPFLFVMEMKPMIKTSDADPDGIYEQSYLQEEWGPIFPDSWGDYEIKPEVIKDAISEIFLLPERERPEYIILLAGQKVFLIHYEKWRFDSYLLFDLEQLFNEAKLPANKNYLALFYALLSKQQFVSDNESLLNSLNEDSHKSAFGVTQTLKDAVIFAVESMANEAIAYEYRQAEGNLEAQKRIVEKLQNDNFARELKDDCLTYVYRLLFLFYAEAREDLEILPVKDTTYQKGYSMEMLRDLEMVHLSTDDSRLGYFFSESLWKLFDYLHVGVKLEKGFQMRPLDSPLFDNKELKHLGGVQFTNEVLQLIIQKLSLSKPTRNKRAGRISYANLGINQLGSVYESLLAYSGFFAKEPMIEVKATKDKTGKDGTFLVPKRRRDDFKEDEILKDPEHLEKDVEHPKGQFLYRLNGRDRQKSASFYTPEVLTQTTVKYTLKGILYPMIQKQKIVEGRMTGEPCSDELLKLKILEPAMGAAAFQNEVINQLSVAYLQLKENEELAAGRSRITPGNYNEEFQKVKAYIASNNVYGVDLNPTAVELGKLALWLNCMHKGMETPFFAHRIASGNAVVGAWFKVYHESDVIFELNNKKKPIPKAWWEKAPRKLSFEYGDNNQRKGWRGKREIYHFLLPDTGMVASFGAKKLKEELSEDQKKAFSKWKNEFYKPLQKHEIIQLQKISAVIDALLEEHYAQMKLVTEDTRSVYAVYGQHDAPQAKLKGYGEKERLANARENRTAPYYKLKLIMDYWCSLWYWDVRDVINLPTREEWYTELMSILQVDVSQIAEGSSKSEIINLVKKSTAEYKLYGNNRIEIVTQSAQTYRYFHPQLEFIEVFEERGGFDVIVGNPPWVKVTFNEKSILEEYEPLIGIRNLSSADVNSISEEILANSVDAQEEIWIETLDTYGLSSFINGVTNYAKLKGQQGDLYKLILLNSLQSLSTIGYSGMVHPQTIFEDSKGGLMREFLYPRLDFIFQFRNEKKLFDIEHTRQYCIAIYSGIDKEKISFDAISNLYHPSTIESCYSSYPNQAISVPGFKELNKLSGKYEWNTRGHFDRIIQFDDNALLSLSQIDNEKYPKLVGFHLKTDLKVFLKIFNQRLRIDDLASIQIKEGWHETNQVKKQYLEDSSSNTKVTNKLENYFFIGNQIHICTPFYRSADVIVNNHHDYSNYQYSDLVSFNYPRSLFTITPKGLSDIDSNWKSSLKVGMNKMLDPGVERTLQPCILPEESLHTGSVISLYGVERDELFAICGLLSSIIFDFYIKSAKKANVSSGLIKSFPRLPKQSKRVQIIIKYVDVLNSYPFVWFNDLMSSSVDVNELINVSSDPAKVFKIRRQLLLEIDVLVAQELKISLAELKKLYLIYFPQTRQYDEDTWYDERGDIIFTNNSQGLRKIGLEKSVWNEVKNKKEGTVTHVIEKSEMYKGQTVEYVAPFEKCDRLHDYEVAWAHFEKVFAEEKQETN